MFLIDVIKRRKYVVHKEGEGINLAIYLIDEFKDREFTFKGFRRKYSGVQGEDLPSLLQKEMDSAVIMYRYFTKVKKYVDRMGVPHLKIRLIGKASMMSKYNPLDIELCIKTEKPEK